MLGTSLTASDLLRPHARVKASSHSGQSTLIKTTYVTTAPRGTDRSRAWEKPTARVRIWA